MRTYMVDTGSPSSCVSGVFLSVAPGKNCKSRKSLITICKTVFFYSTVSHLFTHRSIINVVMPVCSIHTVLDLKFGDPVVILRTALDYYSCYLPGLAQIYLDPAWSDWRKRHWIQCERLFLWVQIRTLHVWVRTASRRHPAGISIQTGFLGSEATDGGGSRDLEVWNVLVLNTQAVQAHCRSSQIKKTESSTVMHTPGDAGVEF